MNYACRKCQMSCGYQVAKIQPYNPPIITHEISNFILYDMCMRDDYHAHISHLSGIMKRHFFPSGGSNAGKLCTEDPVSVSMQFSSKFHAFFNTIIIKGEVLGTIDHFYWKKEYQTRGAPHYHVLLWIRDAPMIGRDDPSKVLAWIEERITCHIPDQENNPELHNLVTRYQLHKCSNYCKRKRKRGKTFVTTCKFGLPREPSESPKVHCVEEKLKKRQKIYQISRTEAEVRVNDYNPLLLLLWKANMDIQFVSESSLALAHYVSGYVTKAERSNMSEIWQEVSESKTIYGHLWSFGVRMLRSRECGLYEASDLLLGDHLFEKSDAVQWIDVSMPHKRNRRLKDHSELLEMESTDPDSENIFKDNLYSNYYPDRPEELQDLCVMRQPSQSSSITFSPSWGCLYVLITSTQLPDDRYAATRVYALPSTL